MTDEEWDNLVHQQNAAMIAEAEKCHRIKQTLKQKLIEARQVIINEFPMDDDGIRRLPDSIDTFDTKIFMLIRELDKSKEKIGLLGQDVEEFRVQLPPYIKTE